MMMSIALMGIVSTSCNHDEDFSQNETKEIRTKSLSEQKELKKVANEIENLNKQFCNGMSNDSDIIQESVQLTIIQEKKLLLYRTL